MTDFNRDVNSLRASSVSDELLRQRQKTDALPVDAFLLAQAAAAASVPQATAPPVNHTEMEMGRVTPYRPGPAEAMQSTVMDVLQSLNDMDITSKRGLQDLAMRRSSSLLADSPTGEEANDPLSLAMRQAVKSMEAFNEKQRNHITAILAIMDAQSNASMAAKVLKGANSTFNKLITG